MAIKDTPKGITEDLPTDLKSRDVVTLMENEWPEMTEEFRKIQREQYVLF